jgi:hypothetical protein
MMGGPIELLAMMDKLPKEPKSLGKIFRARTQSVLCAEAKCLGCKSFYSIGSQCHGIIKLTNQYCSPALDTLRDRAEQSASLNA